MSARNREQNENVRPFCLKVKRMIVNDQNQRTGVLAVVQVGVKDRLLREEHPEEPVRSLDREGHRAAPSDNDMHKDTTLCFSFGRSLDLTCYRNSEQI